MATKTQSFSMPTDLAEYITAQSDKLHVSQTHFVAGVIRAHLDAAAAVPTKVLTPAEAYVAKRRAAEATLSAHEWTIYNAVVHTLMDIHTIADSVGIKRPSVERVLLALVQKGLMSHYGTGPEDRRISWWSRTPPEETVTYLIREIARDPDPTKSWAADRLCEVMRAVDREPHLSACRRLLTRAGYDPADYPSHGQIRAADLARREASHEEDIRLAAERLAAERTAEAERVAECRRLGDKGYG